MSFKYIPLLVLISIFFSISLSAQETKSEDNYRVGKTYFSNEGEMIFSFANIESDSMNFENILRWSPVFNLMGHLNHDFSKNFGLNIGLGFRNVGFITEIPGSENNLKKKYRTYNLGIPIGFKVGDLNQKNPFFLFAGYEIEMPFHYKEKTFEDGDKTDKITGWFSDRTERFTQSVYAGVQFPQGFSIKFKYYLNNFFNADYVYNQDGINTKPFADVDVNVFYFSLTFFPFKDAKSYDVEIKNPDKTVTAINW